MQTEKFLGETPEYWIELQRRARELNVVDLIREIAILRGKVSFYESRIDDINAFIAATKNDPLQLQH